MRVPPTPSPKSSPPQDPHSAWQGRSRRGRVWLIDRRFQLKYTAWIVGLVLAVSIALGALVMRMSYAARTQAQLTANYAWQMKMQSQVSNKLARDNAQLVAGHNQVLLQLFERSLVENERRTEAEYAKVRALADELWDSVVYLRVGMIASVIVLCVLLTLIGLRVTQRIVGPVHRLKRLIRKVGTGKLVTNERLRKGDELEDLFDTFRQMTYSLMALQRGRLATLDVVIEEAHASGASESVKEGLAALRAQLQLGLGVEAMQKQRAGARGTLQLLEAPRRPR